MRTEKSIKILAAALLLALLAVIRAPADPVGDQSSGNSDTPVQPPSESPTTQPGKTAAEGVDTTEGGEFIPSETISADSAIAFPADI